MPRSAAEAFSATAEGYLATMVPSLRPVAARVVERANLAPGERVLDLGTGTGIAAALASGEGRSVIAVDAAAGMLEIARRQHPELDLREMDFGALDLADASVDACLAVHSLLFADDQVAALAEWRRVTRPGGRLSLSVPGPVEVSPTAVFGAIYDRFGIDTSARYPTPGELSDRARAAGWDEPMTEVDPDVVIRLPDEAAFRQWRGVGSRSAATAGWPPERHEELTRAMLAAAPRGHDGAFEIPFGAIYLGALRRG